MTPPAQDRGADALLDLDGQVLVVDPKGEYWARFVVRRVEPSPERPHGLNYSLTLHGPGGVRLAGFDNANATRESRGPGGTPRVPVRPPASEKHGPALPVQGR